MSRSLNKRNDLMWFFTNERIARFLLKLKGEQFRRIFSVAGSGDFAFNCLASFKEVSKIDACDLRETAEITINLKKALIKKLTFEELKRVFKDFKKKNKEDIYLKIKDELASDTKELLEYVLSNCDLSNFINCIKKSGYWYRHSFGQAKKDYLLYLDESKYREVKKNIDKINTFYGDFNEKLKLSNDHFYDLIYISNIFDNRKYCNNRTLYLKTIQKKLKKKGCLLVVTQKSPRRLIKEIKKEGFELYQKEFHRFDLFGSLFGHYSYSFLLFRIIKKR